jgi:hypothetical protein
MAVVGDGKWLALMIVAMEKKNTAAKTKSIFCF